MNALLRRRDRPQRGFTFIELIVILGLLGLAIYFASAGTSGQQSYYQLRGDSERIVAAIQKACIDSACRGEIDVNNANRPITAGLMFFVGSYGQNNVYQTGVGNTYVNWFDDLDAGNNPQAQPAPPLTSASAVIQTAARGLRAETILMKAYNGATSLAGIPALSKFQGGEYFRYRKGRLDIYNGDTPTGGLVTTLNGFFTAVTSTLSPATPVAWTFDVVNINAGWVRVRVLSGGFVETSGINAIGSTVATNIVGQAF